MRCELTPTLAIEDLQRYLAANRFALTDSAKSLFLEAESVAHRANVSLYSQVILIALLTQFAPLRKLLIRQGLSPEGAVYRLKRALLTGRFDEYPQGGLYAERKYRNGPRAGFTDSCMEVALRRGRAVIEACDVLEALLEEHDKDCPVIDNYQWTDERMHVAYNTLSHIKATYDPDLWISFDDIRCELSLMSPADVRKASVDRAPQRLRSAVSAFIADHPDYRLNCFIIMPFRATSFHEDVIASLRKVLRALGFNPLRADDRVYSNDVLANIETYLYGCHFAIAVHDRFLSDEHNANVALEVGYCLGMGKPVCLLKEHTLRSLPSDMQGRIYVPFDGSKIEASLSSALAKWLADNGLPANATSELARSLRTEMRLATGEKKPGAILPKG
jgi:hypothetical protein